MLKEGIVRALAVLRYRTYVGGSSGRGGGRESKKKKKKKKINFIYSSRLTLFS